jgi:hypothetical protein
MMRRLTALLIATALASACASEPVPTAPTPTVPITEFFQGTLTINGGVTHTFNSTAGGTVQATLTALGPDSTAIVGLSLGTWNGNACQIILAKDEATQSSTITGTASSAGGLCVRIYDVGKLTGAATYEVQVTHP